VPLSLGELRLRYPEYDDVDDLTLADALRDTFYPDVPKEQFYQDIQLKGDMGDFARGVGEGVDTLQSSTGAALSLLGKGIGSDYLDETGEDMRLRNIEERKQYAGGGPQQIEDIDGFGSAIDYGQRMIGQQVAPMAAISAGALATGGAGALAGLGPVGVAGAELLGAGVPAHMLNTGETYSNLREEGVPEDQAASTASIAGVPQAALDMIIPARGVGRMMRGGVGMAKDAAEASALKALSPLTVGGRQIASGRPAAMLRGAGGDMVGEAITETGQEGIGMLAEGYEGVGASPEEIRSRLANAAVAGGLVGGGMGGVTGAFTRAPSRTPKTDEVINKIAKEKGEMVALTGPKDPLALPPPYDPAPPPDGGTIYSPPGGPGSAVPPGGSAPGTPPPGPPPALIKAVAGLRENEPVTLATLTKLGKSTHRPTLRSWMQWFKDQGIVFGRESDETKAWRTPQVYDPKAKPAVATPAAPAQPQAPTTPAVPADQTAQTAQPKAPVTPPVAPIPEPIAEIPAPPTIPALDPVDEALDVADDTAPVAEDPVEELDIDAQAQKIYSDPENTRSLAEIKADLLNQQDDTETEPETEPETKGALSDDDLGKAFDDLLDDKPAAETDNVPPIPPIVGQAEGGKEEDPEDAIKGLAELFGGGQEAATPKPEVIEPQDVIDEINGESTTKGSGERADPIDVQTGADLDGSDAKVAEPTDAQKEAGNYKKLHLNWHGHDVSVETAKGQVRSKKDETGKELWSVTMPADYGYVKRTEGADGDQVDIYMGPNPESRKAFVIDQYDADTGRFDEHKIMAGFNSKEEAQETYDKAFSDGKGPNRRRGVTEMDADQLKTWLKDGDTKKPVSADPVKKGSEEHRRAISKATKRKGMPVYFGEDNGALYDPLMRFLRVGPDIEADDAGTSTVSGLVGDTPMGWRSHQVKVSADGENATIAAGDAAKDISGRVKNAMAVLECLRQ
jgi:hypothetical protein